MFELTKHYNWLIFSLINPNIEKRLRQYARGKLLDIGCGEKPYRKIASRYVDEHIGVDHTLTEHSKANIDLMGTAYSIPVADSSFETILCTDVLEHLEKPADAIAEAFRVMKHGGYAIYTVPLFWHLHEEPRDFYRYTRYGLQYLFETNGFEVIEVKALSGFCATFAQELVYFLEQFRIGGPINPLWWLIPPLGIIIQGLAYLLNKFDKSESFTAEYIAVARKP